ncbi:YlbE-like family protein [Thalassobacillus hwangdonensis]|uniref:YlbE-like family protein n=1 Tax=Thalassobacillus hwangdonensis TaxID=546108 RepID=A0ABW3L0E3_9BACI
MQPNTYHYLTENEERLAFIRLHPEWYRKLTRDPEQITEFEKEMKYFFGRTPVQRIEQFGNRLQMMNMLIQMAKIMKEG